MIMIVRAETQELADDIGKGGYIFSVRVSGVTQTAEGLEVTIATEDEALADACPQSDRHPGYRLLRIGADDT